MPDLSHNLFLLTVNLSQLKNKDRVISLFVESLNELLPDAHFNWRTQPMYYENATIELQPPNEGQVDICTRNKTYGYLAVNNMQSISEKHMELLQNGAQMFAILLERLEQEELLNNQKKHLEELVFDKTTHLSKAQAELRSISDNSPDIIMRFDKSLRHLYVNNSISKYTALKPNDYIGKTHKELGFPDDQCEFWEANIQHVFSTKSVFETDFQFESTSGKFIFNWRLIPEFDDANNVVTVLSLTRDITEQKRAELALIESKEQLSRQNIELQKAKEKAVESDRLKSAFLANISHEIRTPMNGIIGFAGLMGKTNITNDKRKYYIEIINDSCQHLLHIVNDVLDISKIETGQMLVNKEETNINDLVTELFSFYRPLANKNDLNLYLKKHLTENQSVINTDKVKLKQIIGNLLSNALKFTKSGYIELGYVLKDAQLVFYVKDTGIGIPDAMQQKVFERFIQADTSLTRDYGGTGLGLSIARAYIALLGGNIWLESEENVGTTFYFNIPYNPINQQNIDKGIPTAENTILVVEDEEINAFYLEELLIEMKFATLLAKNGFEAIELCEKHPEIALVLMDLKMPIMDGFEAMEAIKKFRPNLPIIAQTAFALQEDIERIKMYDFSYYLPKPILETDLIKAISKTLQITFSTLV